MKNAACCLCRLVEPRAREQPRQQFTQSWKHNKYNNKYSVIFIDGTLPEVTGHDFEGILRAGTVMSQESGVELLQKYILELQAS